MQLLFFFRHRLTINDNLNKKCNTRTIKFNVSKGKVNLLTRLLGDDDRPHRSLLSMYVMDLQMYFFFTIFFPDF
jgi:hypothetical protein